MNLGKPGTPGTPGISSGPSYPQPTYQKPSAGYPGTPGMSLFYYDRYIYNIKTLYTRRYL